MKLQIKPEYLELVPRPDKTQLSMLKYSIQEDGQQVKIIVNEDGVVLDGHTRFMICQSLKLDPKYTVKKFTTLEKEKNFVISANLNRRHLTLFERGEILFSWWKEEKIRSNHQGGVDRQKTINSGRSHGGTVTGKKERLLNRFGKIIGCSATVAHELTWLMLHASEEYKMKLRKEEITIGAAYIEVAKPVRKARSEYGVYARYPKCLNCGEPTIPIQNTDCHVHSQTCCTKCGWGN